MKKKIIIAVLAIVLIIGVSYAVKNTNIFGNKKEVKKVEPMIRPISQGLNTLDLSGKKLTTIPADTFDKTDTENLNLSNNNLSGEFPKDVANLKKLKVLDISNNQFTSIPVEWADLKGLESLNLSNNKIVSLPRSLGALTNLKYLDLSGNQYSKDDLRIIKQQLPLFTVVKVN
jgi:hypothetical protein